MQQFEKHINNAEIREKEKSAEIRETEKERRK